MPGGYASCLIIARTPTAPGSLPISTRCVASATYKTGVHKPTFSETAICARWSGWRSGFPEAGPHGRDRWHRQSPRHKHKARTENCWPGSHLESQNFRGLARWGRLASFYALEAAPRDQSRPETQKGAVEVAAMVRRGRAFRFFPRLKVLRRRQ